MQQGNITALHLARVKGTPSDPVPSARALSGQGLVGDRSCRADNPRQVLVMDQETLDKFGLAPGVVKENITTRGLNLIDARAGQVMFIGDEVTLEFVGECIACRKMNDIRPGLLDQIQGRRGMLAMVINGGDIKVGDTARVEP
ncbi:MAG TPA: MOSC domain-containing protein [Dehalococcoidia bacterium]|nr:MOSC domain-containing protein [Dehalococcoidia bacterium]